MSELREALKGSDAEAVRTRATQLAETLQGVSTRAYQAAAAESSASEDGSAGGEGGASGSGEGEGASEETVEGEYKEV